MRGGALMNEINSLIKQAPYELLPLLPCEESGGGVKTNVYNQKVDSYQALIFALILSSQPQN